MTFANLKVEIERLIAASPYSKEEVLSLFNAEPELSMDELMAYSVALEYLHGKKGANYKKLQEQFLKKKDALMEKYVGI